MALLEKLLGEGKSFSQIAGLMNCGLTRNACIGKAHRLGLQSPNEAPRNVKPVRLSRQTPSLAGLGAKRKKIIVPKRQLGPQPPRGKAKPQLAPLATVERIDLLFSEGFEGQSGKISLAQCRDGLCRFPIDQPQGPVRYCGDEAVDGSSWCVPHKRRCEGDNPRVLRGGAQLAVRRDEKDRALA